MANYSVYLPPDGASEKARFIGDGKSLFALLLPPVFLLYHRLWFALGIYVLVIAALGLTELVAGPAASLFLSLLPGLYLFIDGRQLVRGKWEHAGWRETALVHGGNAAEAEQRFFAIDRSVSPGMPVPRSDPSPLAKPVARPNEPGIGLFA